MAPPLPHAPQLRADIAKLILTRLRVLMLPLVLLFALVLMLALGPMLADTDAGREAGGERSGSPAASCASAEGRYGQAQRRAGGPGFVPPSDG